MIGNFILGSLGLMSPAGLAAGVYQSLGGDEAAAPPPPAPPPLPFPYIAPPPTSYLTRAMGGPVSAGMAYTVGEHRREWFVPKVDGVISNKAPMTSGGGDTFNIVAPSPQTAAAEIIRIRRKQSYLAGVA